MMKISISIICLFLSINLAAQNMANEKVPVTPLNFVRAETDNYFKTYADQGIFGIIHKNREFTPIDEQYIIKMNRDTYYSGGVFDLTSPLTIIKPKVDRFQSMLVINQDHLVKRVEHDSGEFTLTIDSVGTRYVFVVFRTIVDINNPDDVVAANKAQDDIKIVQKDKGRYEAVNWDLDQLKAIRENLTKLGLYTPTAQGRFGDADQIDPINHLIGTAVGWGGNPPEAAVYIPIIPPQNDGKTQHTLTVKDVPVDGFWSISIYNSDGFFVKNEYNAYVLNDRNTTKNPDGSITINFGGDPKQPNYLYIMKGWQYVVRLYQPQDEIINGDWNFPVAQPINKN